MQGLLRFMAGITLFSAALTLSCGHMYSELLEDKTFFGYLLRTSLNGGEVLTVTGITPNSGLAAGTVAITELAGTGFRPGATVRLIKAGRPDINATDVIAVSSTRITCSVNITGAVYGQWDVVVTNPDGLSGALVNGFTMTWNAPSITSVSPTQGLAPNTIDISLIGSNFEVGAVVKLTRNAGADEITASPVWVTSDTLITCSASLAGAMHGFWDVVVTNPDGLSGSLPNGFEVTWTQFTVTYNGNNSVGGGGLPPEDSTGYYQGDTVTVYGPGTVIPGSLTKFGHSFSRWTTEQLGGGMSYNPGNTFIMGLASVTLFAQWTKNKYKVDFDLQGGDPPVPSDLTLDYGSLVTEPLPKPSRAGFYLSGWVNAAGNLWDFNLDTVPANDMTLYARWITISPWTRLSGIAGAVTFGTGISIDSSGNSYVIGSTNGNLDGQILTGTQDVFVIKYNSLGDKQWTKLFGTAGRETFGGGISVDTSGNSYVTGSIINGIFDNTFFIIKYDSLGIEQWIKLGDGGAAGISIDSNGNSYVTGKNSNLMIDDVFVTKYDPLGNIVWTRLLGAAGFGTSVSGISVDPGGNSYVTGNTNADLGGQILTGTQDVFVTKYDSSGNRQWTRLLGAAGANTSGYGISVDSGGNNYVTGVTNGNLDGQTKTGTYDVFVSKYDSSGNRQWTRLFGAVGAETTGFGISVEPSGNSYVTGYTCGNLDGLTKRGTRDVFVTKYDTSGNKQWTSLLGAAGAETYGTGISVDSSGNNYVTGVTNGNLDGQILTGTRDVFVTTKLNQ